MTYYFFINIAINNNTNVIIIIIEGSQRSNPQDQPRVRGLARRRQAYRRAKVCMPVIRVPGRHFGAEEPLLLPRVSQGVGVQQVGGEVHPVFKLCGVQVRRGVQLDV